MRRLVLGLSVVSAFAGLLLFTACERTDVLRVAAVNGGMPVYCDIADWGTYTDPTDPEAEPEIIYSTHDDTAEFEFQYVEIGAGLPTWTPYHAEIKEYTLSYESQLSSGYVYEDVTIPMALTVAVDPEANASTTARLVVAPMWMKDNLFGGDIGSDPTEGSLLDVVWTEVEFTALDSVSGRKVKGQANIQLEFGDFWDDPGRIGQ